MTAQIQILWKDFAILQSCYRAHELMGAIAEKTNSYEDAAKHYDTAWRILNQQDPAVGKSIEMARYCLLHPALSQFFKRIPFQATNGCCANCVRFVMANPE